MVNIYGDNTFAGSKRGKRGPPKKPGSIDPPGYRGEQRERGEQGENNGLYSQYAQHSKIKWIIDHEPDFWIDGYDIKLKSFK